MTVKGLTGANYSLESKPIGSGGEGDIYRVDNADGKLAKIYKSGALTAELEQKLKIMIEHPPNEAVLSQVAWPLDLAYENGKCRGFIMPELSINAELGEVYKYPSALPISSQQKINIAQNICVVISEVHRAGYVFGDFNPRNIGLDTNTGLVSFLDTDTYHVVDAAKDKVYRCNVCASGYAAPELLEKCSDFVASNPTASSSAYAQTPLPTFTKETDNFALAIHIFKLLMNGYTPFGGIIETASVSQASPGVGDAAVRRNNYCFRPGYKPQSVAIPGLETLPEEIADLFTRAFIEGKVDPRKRPDAVEWHGALDRYEQTLVTCADNPLHQYDSKNDECPLCEADRRFGAVMAVPSGGGLKQKSYAKPLDTAQNQSAQTPAGGFLQNAHSMVVNSHLSTAKNQQPASIHKASNRALLHPAATTAPPPLPSCKTCGKKYQPGDIFCLDCGQSLPAQSNSEWICEKCNQRNDGSRTSCRYCKVTRPATVQTVQNQSSPTRTHTAWLECPDCGEEHALGKSAPSFCRCGYQLVTISGSSGKGAAATPNTTSSDSPKIVYVITLFITLCAVFAVIFAVFILSQTSATPPFTGYGVFTWADGSEYTGDFVNDVRTGQGTLAFANGDVYVGEFFNNLMHGQGTMTFSDGWVHNGTWYHNEFQWPDYITIRGVQYNTSLTELNLNNQNLRNEDIVSLKYMTNLTNLNLSRNQISDLTPLSALSNLTALHLAGAVFYRDRTNITNGQISDLSPLSELTNLTYLNLHGNQISDLTPLSNLENLTTLNLNANRSGISDWSPVAHVPIVHGRPPAQWQTQSSVQRTTPSPAQQSPVQRSIEPPVAGHSTPQPPAQQATSTPSHITIRGVQYRTSLRQLDLRLIQNLRNEEIVSLQYMTNLTNLALDRTQISDWTPLYNLTNLTWLTIHSSQFNDLTPLSELTNLIGLNLFNNQISDLSPLSELTNLTHLSLNDNHISDLTPLSNLTSLEYLTLRGNQISDLTPLSRLTNLTNLNVWNNQISNLTPLSNLTNLTLLYLIDNQISDLTPLSNLTNLTGLGLGHNQISDLTPLSNLTNPTWLNLGHNQISDWSPVAHVRDVGGRP